MITLERDQLVFSFPEVHRDAKLSINFQRTLRIPNDGKVWPLPPGLGNFPLVHVDDYSETVPDKWIDQGGIMLPMYQSEAMWVYFRANYVSERAAAYPFAIQIFTGKINAVTGKSLEKGLHEHPQDYVVAPTQPWLDGYCVRKGVIRQFVAMPLGEGITAEEQITGEAKYGGLQLVVYPMRADEFERRFPRRKQMMRSDFACLESWGATGGAAPMACPEMGLAPGGEMRQEIYDDPFDIDDWDVRHRSRCFVHIANSKTWRAITGQAPPTKPVSAAQYTSSGFPWFDYYDENASAVPGSSILKKLQSVGQKRVRGYEEDDDDDNDSGYPARIIKLRKNLRRDQVREGDFWDESI